MGVTIKEVAADAGVSTATVSHVVNKSRYVSKELRDRVNASIVKLKYYPNDLVRGMRSKKSNTIGIVLPSISNETLGALTEMIQKILFDLNYNTILCNTSYDCALEERALETLIMKQADAIIIVPVDDYSDKMKEIKEMDIPLVLVDRAFEGAGVDSIRSDGFKGTYDIVSYLIRMGHRKIGYIDRYLEQSHSQERKNGYIQALLDNGIPFEPDFVVGAQGFDFLAGAEAAKALLTKRKDITAISAHYDVIAFGAMRGLADLGYAVPGDKSVVGYDGMEFTEVTTPRLTTVKMPLEQMAEKICELTLRRLKEKHAHADADEKPGFVPVDIIVEPELILRESVRERTD